jgi:hypothetical protein
MHAIAFALAIAFHGDPFVQSTTVQSVAPLAALEHTQKGPVMIPFGQAVGTYDIGQGRMLALLEDASGLPLWVLDAEVYENGGIDGDLLLLQYATNPAIAIGALSVSGQLQLDETGNGSFYATVFQFGGGGGVGAIPVFPIAMIEGQVKQAALGHSVPPSTGASGLVAAAGMGLGVGPQVATPGVIVCPKAFVPEIGPVEAFGALGQGGFAPASRSTASGFLRWTDPVLATTGSGGLDAASAGAKRERAAAGHELLGPNIARVQLRWWLLK